YRARRRNVVEKYHTPHWCTVRNSVCCYAEKRVSFDIVRSSAAERRRRMVWIDEILHVAIVSRSSHSCFAPIGFECADLVPKSGSGFISIRVRCFAGKSRQANPCAACKELIRCYL